MKPKEVIKIIIDFYNDQLRWGPYDKEDLEPEPTQADQDLQDELDADEEFGEER